MGVKLENEQKFLALLAPLGIIKEFITKKSYLELMLGFNKWAH